MRTLARLVVLLLAGLCLVPVTPAHACSCGLPPSAQQLLASAALLYLGDLEVRSSDDGGAEYDVTVLEPFAGRPGGQRRLSETFENTSCGHRVVAPGRYLVIEYRPGRISTSCYGPAPADVDSSLVGQVRAAVTDGAATPRAVDDTTATARSKALLRESPWTVALALVLLLGTWRLRRRLMRSQP